MRISYYRFPDAFSSDEIFDALCAEGIYSPDQKKKFEWDYSGPEDDMTLHSGKISWIKKMIKKYGGYGFTEHCERDGGVFEVTEICVQGNNSRHKYNHHL